MTLADLRSELLDRGFDYLGSSRANLFINRAYKEIHNTELWPYRLTTATGSAPLTISDLGPIEDVTDSGQNSIPLAWLDRRTLVDLFSDITTTGSPSYWYVDNGVVRTFPVGGTLAVRYYATASDLSADTDEPEFPDDFHLLIVDVAVRKAYIDRDNFDAAAALDGEIERQKEEMRTALLDQQVQGPKMIADFGASSDW